MALKISVVIPARNEERYLPACLDAIRAAEKRLGGEVEKIVVLNRCTDSTERIAGQAGCRLLSEEAKNLARIRNSGVLSASGDLVVTIDADSLMSENFLLDVRKTLSLEQVVGGGVMMYPSRWSPGILATALCLVPLVLWYRVSGGAFYFRKQDFLAINGFNENLVSVEDIDFARRLKALGNSRNQKFVTLFRSYIVTSTRKFDRLGDWYFLKHPRLFLSLFSGTNTEAANKIWYDFER